MKPGVIKGAVPDIDELEAAEAAAPSAFEGVIPLMIPTPTYRALSDAAAKQNKTVAEVIVAAIGAVLGEG